MLKRMVLLSALAIAGCDDPQPAPVNIVEAETEPLAPVEPPEAAPLSEAPSAVPNGQGAGQVVQTYFALIEARDYAGAWDLRWPGGGDDAASEQAFAESFGDYAEYHANVGAPGRVSGAAGSLYVEVPVQIYGRMKDGEPFSSAGTITLRRVNDVPGSTEAQRRWRIYTRD